MGRENGDWPTGAPPGEQSLLGPMCQAVLEEEEPSVPGPIHRAALEEEGLPHALWHPGL